MTSLPSRMNRFQDQIPSSSSFMLSASSMGSKSHLAHLLSMASSPKGASTCSDQPEEGGGGDIIRPTPKKPCNHPSPSLPTSFYQEESIRTLSKTWEYLFLLRQLHQQQAPNATPMGTYNPFAANTNLKGQFPPSPCWLPQMAPMGPTPSTATFTSLPLSTARRMPVVVISREKKANEDEDDDDDEEIVVGTEDMFNNERPLSEDRAAQSQPCSNLDVAACDGPVHFRRVANPCTSKDVAESDGNASKSAGGSRPEVTYQCLFCNHIFKSHYCYQKHKRRHLNPFLADFHQVKSPDKKSLILKDINVQFFPCKICGAKFPSYYFVHKHKKLWHDDEDSGEHNEPETEGKP